MASNEAKATKVLLIEPPKAVWDLMGDCVAPLLGLAHVPGYTSHAIGSRSLDTAIAGDFGDGRIELLVPNQARTSLGAIRRKPGGAEVAWTIPVGGRVMTNLAIAAFPDGTLAVGVGHERNRLRLWLP